MGNSVSCFDPVREHPPYSWPKDHPGRAAAIAEIKRKRKNQKIVGAQGTAHTVEIVPEKDAAAEAAKKAEEERLKKEEEAKKAEEEALKAEEEAKKAEEEAKKAEEEAKKAEEEAKKVEEEAKKAEEEAKKAEEAAAEEAAKKAEEEAKQKAEEEAKNAEEAAKLKAEEEAKKAEESAAIAAAAVATEEAEKKVEEERIKAEEEAKKTEEEAKLLAEKEAREAEEKAKIDAEAEAAKTTAEKLAALDAEKTPEASSIDDRRAMFDRSDDVLPGAKDLSRDVLDPVTNEYITLEEYRRRQSERAQGVVKERVDKFEEIDDEASKQKAELAAIEAARTEAQEKTDWKYKHEGDTETASPLPVPTADEVVESSDPVEPIDSVLESVETAEPIDTSDVLLEDIPVMAQDAAKVDELISKIPAVPAEMPPEVHEMETEKIDEGVTGLAASPES